MRTKNIFSQFFICCLFSVLFQSIYIETAMGAFPKPKYSFSKSDNIEITKNVKIHSANAFYTKYKATFDSINSTILKYGSNKKTIVDIKISKISDFSTIETKYQTDLIKPEAYLLEIKKNNITIFARDDKGLLNGLSTLEALIEENLGILKEGDIIDFPDLKMRVLHLSMWPCTIDDFKESMRLARLEHFNTLIWLSPRGVKLKSLKHLMINHKNSWTIEQFKEMIAYVKQNGLEIIPQINLLSHQKSFMSDNYPHYMYNKATYDPRKKELYDELVFPAIDELLLLTGATKFHIGHDEVVGWSKKHYSKNILNEDEKQLPPELFLQDVLVLHNYLREKDVETWMWSDMLYTKTEFPSMKKAGANLNGMNGFSALRSKIPRDIVLCVWHYRGKQQRFPTAELLANDGHKVLGATWKVQKTTINYAKYIYKMSKLSKNAEGMIATTWYGLTGKRKSIVQDIIKFSGEAFWNSK